LEQLVEQEKLETLEGAKLDVVSAKDGALVNGIEILESDVTADNGVIHIVGGLLTAKPAGETGTEEQQYAGAAPARLQRQSLEPVDHDADPGDTWLVTQYGRAFTVAGFGN
jgi:hypothetical protein